MNELNQVHPKAKYCVNFIHHHHLSPFAIKQQRTHKKTSQRYHNQISTDYPPKETVAHKPTSQLSLKEAVKLGIPRMISLVFIV